MIPYIFHKLQTQPSVSNEFYTFLCFLIIHIEMITNHFLLNFAVKRTRET